MEAICLVEKGRLPEVALEWLIRSTMDSHTMLMIFPLDLAVALVIHKIPRETLPDMPDRIIAVSAIHLQLSFITHDQRIWALGVETIW